MFVIQSYPLAVVFCVITMLCWGSWANTQKLAGKRWRFELFYWDYVLGVMAMSLFFALTLGSLGDQGRSFQADLSQAEFGNLAWAFFGGVIFNAANILLVAAIAIAGMSVAFPVGIGLALVVGVLVNYFSPSGRGEPVQLFLGVALITGAIILNALAYRQLPGQSTGGGRKGLILAVVCGLLMGNFYRFVGDAMSKDFINMEPGKLSPYTAMVFFALGVLLSNYIFNTAIMLKPFTGTPIPMTEYFQGRPLDHLWGVVGGMIWAVGMMFSIIAFGRAGSAISYGLGQGATLVAACWGVFIWKEFREAPPTGRLLLWWMFQNYIVGLASSICAGAG